MIGRFTQEDPAFDGLNWYTYCAGNPIAFIDPSGMWMEGDENLSAQAQAYTTYYGNKWSDLNYLLKWATGDYAKELRTQMDHYHALANDIRQLDAQGLVYGVIHDVALFAQGQTNLCWAYSQVMVEDYVEGSSMTQADADERARGLAESVHGTDNWNQGYAPTNSVFMSNAQISADDLTFDNLRHQLSGGPIYAHYSNYGEGANSSTHYLVVTGAATAKGHTPIVTTNNPSSYGFKNVQSYYGFISSVPKDKSGMKLTGVGGLQI